MNEQTTEVATTEAKPMQVLRADIEKMGDQFIAALPKHISADKFKRTVMTAISLNPELIEADRRTLLASCMKAASDGLLLDNRDAALIVFKQKDGDTGRYVKVAQYLPMIGGILKRMRQSGDIKSVSTACAHERDEFAHWTDESGEHLTHKPAYGTDRGKVTLAYALIRTKDDGVYIEVMDVPAIEKVRAISRAKFGPWVDWWDEMARKTVLRRLAKRAPMSTDVAVMLQNDDENYDLSQAMEVTHLRVPPANRPTRPRALEAIAGNQAMDAALGEDAAPAPVQTGTEGGVF